ncbi:MAG TPA: exopolysaccharide biosynthesis polyprenyl glycosylphosphotransferase, partial [Thiolinea sp.]|nr:exopolysaccharide biosynthesis polyprenyl glycosylphosphotransferase [Thiolinea sp.]
MVDKKISSELVYRSTDTLVILSIVLLASLYSHDYNLEGYLASGLGASLIFGLVGRFTDIYTSWSGRPFFRDEAMRTIVTWLTTFFLLVFVIFVSKSSDQFSRVVLVSWLISTPILLILTRYTLRVLLSHLKRIGIHNRNIAIVGITDTGIRFAESVNHQPESGLQVAGFYSVELDNADLPNSYANIGGVSDLLEAARSGTWDQIYLALPNHNQNFSSTLISQLADTITPVRLIPDNFTHALLHNKYLEIADTPVLCIYDAPLSAQHAFVKRAEDLIIGSLLLLMLLPIMAIIALVVKLSSPGPVLFKQSRHGLRGEEFQVWKFRTMTVCENGDVIRQATRNDIRVTKVGAFLRKTSLDELPQFFNV